MATSRVEIITGQLAGSILSNAASEATLQELLAAVKKLEKSFVTSNTNTAAGSGTGSTSSNTGSSTQSQGFGLLGAAASTLSRTFNSLGTALGTSVRLLKANDTALSSWTKGAADAASQLPLVGKAFGGLLNVLGNSISILEQWNRSLQNASGAGASFSNSIIEFRKYAAMTNMDLEQFSRLVRENSEGLAALGGTVSQGAISFSKVSKELVGPNGIGTHLLQMGMSIEEVNEGLVHFLSSTVRGTRVTDQNSSQIANMYAEYSVHLDKISKLTGETRKQLEEKSKKDAQDAAWQLYLSQQDETTRVKLTMQLNEMRAIYGETGADYLKQMTTVGVATTAGTRALDAMVHGLRDNTTQMISNAKTLAVTPNEFSKMTNDYSAKMRVATDQAIKRNEHVMYSANAGIGTVGKHMLEATKGYILQRDSSIELGKLTEHDVKKRIEAATTEQQSREIMTSSLRSFSKGITNLYNTFVGGITTLLGSISKSVGNFLSSIGINSTSIDKAFGKMSKTIESGFKFLDAILNGTNKTFSNFTSKIQEIGGKIANSLFPQMEKLANIIKTVVSSAFIKLKDVFDNLVKVGNDFYQGVTSRLIPVVEVIEEIGSVIINFIKNVTIPIFETMGKILTGTIFPAFQKISNIVINTVLPALGNVAGYIADKIIPVFKNIVFWVQDNIVPVFERFHKIIDTVLNPAIDFVSEQFLGLIDLLGEQLGPTIEFLTNKIFKPLGNIIFDNVLPAIGNVAGFIGGTLLRGLHFVLDVIENFSTYLELGSLKISEFGQQLVAVYYAVMSKITIGPKYDNLLKQQEAAIQETKNRQLKLEEDVAKKREERDRRLIEGQEKRDKERHEKQQAAIKKEEKAREDAIKEGKVPQAVPATPSGPQPGASIPTAPADLQKYLQATALVESSGNAKAKASTSSAGGMFQFIDSTWKQMVKEMGKNYTLEDKFDPAKATEVMAYFTQKQQGQLEKGIGRKASNTDLYMSHFLGAGGATKFLNAMAKDPTQSAASLDPKAAAANKSIYFDKGRERSLQEVYELMGKKITNAEKAVEAGRWGGRAIPADVLAISNKIQSTNTATAMPAQQQAATVVAANTTPTAQPAPKDFREVLKEQREAAIAYQQRMAAANQVTPIDGKSSSVDASKQIIENKAEAEKLAKANEDEAKGTTKQSSQTSVPVKETTLNDVLISLEGLNKSMGILISVTQDSNDKLVKATKHASTGNIHGVV
jgi:hypothetical protein